MGKAVYTAMHAELLQIVYKYPLIFIPQLPGLSN